MILVIVLSAISIIFFLSFSYSLEYQNFSLLSVRLKPEHARDRRTKALVASAKKRVAIGYVLLVLASGLIFIPVLRSLKEILLLLFILLSSLWTFYCLQKTHEQLLALKSEQGWVYQSQTKSVDTKVLVQRGKAAPHVVWAWLIWAIGFLPVLLYFLLPNVEKEGFLFFLITPIILIVLPITYPHVSKFRIQGISQKTASNQNYYRRLEYVQSMSFLYLMAILTVFQCVFSLFILLRSGQFWMYLHISLFFLCIIGLIFLMQRKLKVLEESFSAKDDWQVEESTSQYRWGWYYNPDDARLWVPKQMGVGMTVNTAKPAGKAIQISTVLLVVVVIAFAFASFAIRQSYEIHEDSISFRATMYGKELTKEDILSIELTEEKISGNRTNGIGTELLSIGHFTLPDYGASLLYIYNDTDVSIKIHLAKEGREWIFYNEETNEETKEAYEKMLAWFDGQE